MKTIAVIGGGPAGLMAAYAACHEAKQKVVLFETNDRLGKKLSLAGGTRCNITHTGTAPELASHYHEAEKFLLSSLFAFDNNKVREFFRNELGLETVVEPTGRVFPQIQSGKEVTAAFSRYLQGCGVNLHTGYTVSNLEVFADGVGVDGERFSALILCTGGVSYPQTGSTGWGLSAVKKLGHSVTGLLPGLTGINVTDTWLRELSGITLPDVGLKLGPAKTGKTKSSRGEILFTHFGLSGPAALNLSRWAAKEISSQGNTQVLIDLAPSLNQDALSAKLFRLSKDAPRSQIKNVLRAVLPEAVAQAACLQSGCPPDKEAGQMQKAELLRLVELLKGARVSVQSLRPLSTAQVTVGGVKLKEVDPKTLRSKVVPHLYFAGEVLDTDGETGGYNIQAAFSTGYAAGLAAAKS